ncbi:MAG: hypothetical protein EON95_05830 [Caulobacteraceae bacterium]|nr:hypothetical protein [Caulobacter sp.]RYF94301.1 MAG: hypothetical protein EON95_05830 [Caulobacteraceae bacterium]
MAEPTAGPPAPVEGTRRRPDPVTLVLAVISVLYPFIALFAVRSLGPIPVVAALCLLLVARVAFGWGRGVPLGMALAPLAVALLMGLTMLWDAHRAVRFYPVFMSGAMLAAFAASVVKGPSMIERLARIAEPDLPEAGVAYTRKVTMVWCLFLFLNGLVALWTALYASLEVWTLYNGFISYVLMGALLGGELLIRKWVRREKAA